VRRKRLISISSTSARLAVVGQSCQWVASCLFDAMILQLTRLGHPRDYLIGVELALSPMTSCPLNWIFRLSVLALPFYFEGVDYPCWLVAATIGPFARILNQATRKVYTQQFLF